MTISFFIRSCIIATFTLVSAHGYATDYRTQRYEPAGKRAGVQMQQGNTIQENAVRPDSMVDGAPAEKTQAPESKANVSIPVKTADPVARKAPGPNAKAVSSVFQPGEAAIPTETPAARQHPGSSMPMPTSIVGNRGVVRIASILAPQPRKGEVHKYFQEYDAALKKLVEPSGAYTQKRNQCTNRGFSPEEQTSAGCMQNDTYAECSKKLLMWCTAAERKPYHDALAALVAAAKRLSDEADADAKKRSDYLGFAY